MAAPDMMSMMTTAAAQADESDVLAPVVDAEVVGLVCEQPDEIRIEAECAQPPKLTYKRGLEAERGIEADKERDVLQEQVQTALTQEAERKRKVAALKVQLQQESAKRLHGENAAAAAAMASEMIGKPPPLLMSKPLSRQLSSDRSPLAVVNSPMPSPRPILA